ncbi:MAG TPA: hypothetical protein VMZ00_03245 [Sporichthya sp.]|nr:hypothetical protein [Sporichthya sp.]
MNTRSQVACALAGLIGFLVILPAFLIADYFVPPDADWTAQQFADFYGGETDRIRVGLLLLLVAVTGWGTIIAVVTVQMLRFEGKRPVLTALNAVTGTAVYVLLNLFAVFLIAAAFRPGRDPDVTQALHDLGWFMAFLAAPVFCTQALAVGCAVLGDRSANPVYPRWFGYVGIWVALLLLPGTLLMFFHDGPFAYHGVISYWIPLFTFGGWMAAQGFCALMAALAEAKTEAGAAVREPVLA